MRRRRLSAGAALLGLVLSGAAVAAPVAHAAPVNVLVEDFEDGDFTPLVQNGDATLSVVAVDGDQALQVAGRANDYDGVKSPAGLLTPGTEYTFSMDVRLADGTPGTTSMRFVAEPSYSWFGNTGGISASGWTTVTGSYTVPADGDTATARIYIGSDALSGGETTYTYLVDNFSILGPDDGMSVVSSVDFEDGSWAPWVQNGDATLSVVAVDGDQALQVAGRANDYDGVKSPAGLLTPGTEYTFSMDVRLADGTPGTTSMRFVAEPSYSWFGNTGGISASGWTTVTGSYTVPADGDTATARIYIGSDALSGGETTYTYLVDNLTITAPAAPAGPVTVAENDFEDDSWAPWVQNGDATLSVVTVDGDKALQVAGRANDYDGLKSPAGLLTPGTEYTFSMDVRLADGTPGTTSMRFVAEPSYSWFGNTGGISASGWTTVTGSYTVPADGDTATARIYIGSDALSGGETTYTYLVDNLTITTPSDGVTPGTPVDLTFDFEDGLQGWVPRGDEEGDPTVDVTTTEARGGAQSAMVSGRTSQGDGIGYDVSGVFEAGVTYEISAWVKFADGEPTDDIWLSMRRGTGTFQTVAQFTGITNTGWTEVTGTYTMSGTDSAFVYFETPWPDGAASTFLVDDVRIRSMIDPDPDLTLTPIKDTVPFPVGVAIDERETTGGASELLLHHFEQVTAENHMKVENWYTATPWEFQVHPQATAIMDFAQANDLRVYGHVLVWHSQTPAWFFTDAEGNPLSTSDADKQIMRDRLRDHIFNVAEALSTEYGLFGSATNPLVAWDVVNEVVSDSSEYADGLRRSEWYRILGEEFIDLSFIYADEAFNDVYAVADTDPVTLFINDYNTEQLGKQQRYYDLVTRLLDRGVPIDGVGHQFHVSLSMPVSALEAAIVKFADLPLTQVVTELDVTVGNTPTEALLIEQGYYFRDAFNIFRAYADELYSVTVWGLTDPRSWRSTQAPLVFDGQLQAKPAYYGIVDEDLPAAIRTANVFQGSVALDGGATTADEWDRLPLLAVGGKGDFQLRWAPDHLTVYVAVEDTTVDATDGIEVQVGETTYWFGRDGSGDVSGVAAEVAGGWQAVVHVPLADAGAGDTLAADVRIVDDEVATGWNTPGVLGTLTLVEPLSFTKVVEAGTAPTIDGTVDGVWATANTVTTSKQVQGTDTATADVRTLWQGNTLYVLMEVTDDVLDASGSDPWIQDSVEIYVDAGNVKNGPYRYDDTQIRINFENVVSFGTGDEAFQANRLDSATSVTDTGYVVEAAISLLEYGGLGTFHGLDFQVNDAADGARLGITNWADPTGLGYQSTARWGVGQLVAAGDVTPPPGPGTPPPVDPEPVTPTIGGTTWRFGPGPVVLHGTAAPNATVYLYAAGAPVATLQADGDGNWTYTHTVHRTTPFWVVADGRRSATKVVKVQMGTWMTLSSRAEGKVTVRMVTNPRVAQFEVRVWRYFPDGSRVRLGTMWTNWLGVATKTFDVPSGEAIDVRAFVIANKNDQWLNGMTKIKKVTIR